MSKFIYEMVEFQHADPGFRVTYRYENFFSSRKAAIRWVTEYINWMMKCEYISEAIEMKYIPVTKTTEVCWKTLRDGKVEYYGIKRHMILN